jgi:hypothetical protein
MMNKSIKFLVITALTGGEVLIASTSVNDDKDFYTQYHCSCGQEDNNTSCCKTMSALLKKIGLDKNLEQLKQQYEYWHTASKHLTTKVTNQIERDIHRTFPEMFNTQESNSKEYETTHAKTLQKVLMTIAAYNTTWSYLQGFNFIVGALMRHSIASIAFGVFCYLMNDKNISPLIKSIVYSNKDYYNIINTDTQTVLYILKKENTQAFNYVKNIDKAYQPYLSNNMVTSLVCFRLGAIKGDKNQINVIYNYIDKGSLFLLCMIVAEILYLYHCSITNNNNSHENILLNSENI